MRPGKLETIVLGYRVHVAKEMAYGPNLGWTFAWKTTTRAAALEVARGMLADCLAVHIEELTETRYVEAEVPE